MEEVEEVEEVSKVLGVVEAGAEVGVAEVG